MVCKVSRLTSKLQEFQSSVYETCQVLDVVALLVLLKPFSKDAALFCGVSALVNKCFCAKTGEELKTWVAERRVDMANIENSTQHFHTWHRRLSSFFCLIVLVAIFQYISGCFFSEFIPFSSEASAAKTGASVTPGASD